jgi:hypothetical protein
MTGSYHCMTCCDLHIDHHPTTTSLTHRSRVSHHDVCVSMCATDHAKYFESHEALMKVIREPHLELIYNRRNVHFTLDFSTPNACHRVRG